MLYPGLEDIVDILIDNDVQFSFDGDVDLLDHNGIVIATAGIILEKQKIVIDPIDIESKLVFERAGYKIIDSREFDINMIKQI